MPQINRCKTCANHGISDGGHLILLRFAALRALGVRSKTEEIDRYVRPRYGPALKPTLRHPAPMHARQLRAPLVRREALVKDLLRELNRQERMQSRFAHQHPRYRAAGRGTKT